MRKSFFNTALLSEHQDSCWRGGGLTWRDWVSQSDRLELPDPSTCSRNRWIKPRRQGYASALRCQKIASEHSYFSNFSGGASPDPPSKISRLRRSLYEVYDTSILPIKVENDCFSPQFCNLLIQTQNVLHCTSPKLPPRRDNSLSVWHHSSWVSLVHQ